MSIQYTQLIDSSNIYDPLNLYIQDTMISRHLEFETRNHKTGRIFAQFLSIILGSIGNLTFVNINGKFAGDNQPYKWTLIVGNALSFGIVTSWVLLKLVNSYLKPRTSHEEVLLRGQNSRCVEVTIKIVAVTGGLLSQVPWAYIAYVYNDNNPVYPFVILTSNASVPIHSLELTFDAIARNQRYSEFEKTLVKSKQALIQLLNNVIDILAEMSPSERDVFFAKIDLTRREISEEKRLSDYIETLFDLAALKPKPRETPTWVKVGNYVFGSVGIALSASLLAHHWMGGYEAAKLADDDNQGLMQSSAALVVFSNTYITIDLVVKSTLGIYNGVVNQLRKTTKKHLYREISPTVAAGLRITALAASSVSYGAAAQFSDDYFDESYAQYLKVTSSIALGCFLTTAIFTCIEEGINWHKMHYGNDHEMASFGFQNEIQNLIHLIDRCRTIDYAKALLAWYKIMKPSTLITISAPNSGDLEEFIKH